MAFFDFEDENHHNHEHDPNHIDASYDYLDCNRRFHI